MKRIITQYILVFCIGFIAGMSIFHLLDTDGDATATVAVDNPAEVTARVVAVEYQYQEKVDSLSSVNNSLQSKVNRTQTELKKIKQQNVVLSRTLDELIIVNNTSTDTAVLLNNCDSMALAVTDLLELHTIKDSLYKASNEDMQFQLAIKDSIIILQEEKYDTLKESLNRTLEQQQELITANQQCNKQIKKQKKGKKFLTALLAVVAGISVYQAVK